MSPAKEKEKKRDPRDCFREDTETWTRNPPCGNLESRSTADTQSTNECHYLVAHSISSSCAVLLTSIRFLKDSVFLAVSAQISLTGPALQICTFIV